MPLVGDVLAGRYRIDAPLGAGGMASVWRARDERLDRDVAVKILLPNLAADPVLAARFDREARALAAGSHPAVVAIFDVEPGDPATGREPFCVMELCDGGSLADRLEHGPLPPDTLVPILVTVAEGLAALHERGIVHRDVKPGNILVCDGRPKIADFGLARAGSAPEMTALTAAGTLAGTLAYLAPELLAGAPATPASDTYALGVVAFRGLTGRLPKPAETFTDVIEHREAEPPPASTTAPGLGDAFDRPIAAALAVDPARRPTPSDFAADLRAALAARQRAWAGQQVAGSAAVDRANSYDATVPSMPVAASTAPAAGGARRRRVGPLALAALAGVVVGLAGLSLVFGDRDGFGLSVLASPSPSLAPATPSPSPTLSPSPTPSPTPTATPTPSPPPTPSPDPTAQALAAIDSLRATIDDARSSDGGLRGRDVNRLDDIARSIASAVRDEESDTARERADRFESEVRDLDDVDNDVEQALLDGLEAVREAIPD